MPIKSNIDLDVEHFIFGLLDSKLLGSEMFDLVEYEVLVSRTGKLMTSGKLLT